LKQAGAQNWTPVPCYNGVKQLEKIFVDSLHNELILNTREEYNICNTTFKGVLAYNGSYYHDLNFGLDACNPSPITSGDIATGCISYNGKTLFGGYFASVGSNTLPAEALALWDGTVWDTLPKRAFKYNPTRTGPIQVVYGLLKDNGKIWIYGQFDTLGGVPGKNLYTFDGNNFVYKGIPTNNFDVIYRLIKYKNEIYATGLFFDYPSYSICRLAKYDGLNWTSVGNGVQGSLDNAAEMVEYNDTLYIAGSFSKGSGNVGNYIMKWDGNQLYDAGFGNFYGWGGIWKLLVYKKRLYAFGDFTHAADQKAFGVAYYEKGQWVVPTDSFDNTITSAAVYKGEIYVSGYFQSVNGDPSMKFFAKLRCPDFDFTCTNGLNEQGNESENISVYPNPVKDQLSVSFKDNSYGGRYRICNCIGEIIQTGILRLKDNIITLNNFPQGLYIIEIKNGDKKSAARFIKIE
jgi:hypothetical protein